MSAIRRWTNMPHLCVGGGFPRASQCITTFFSSESKGKITSSGSWIKTGPNSSVSLGKKKIETMVIRIITSWAPHIFNSQWFFSISPPSGLVHYFQTNLCRKENKKKLHSVVELETTKQIVPITSLLFYSRLLMFKVIGGDYSNILYIVRGGPHRKCFRATEWITQIFVAEQKNWLLLYKCRILWWNK